MLFIHFLVKKAYTEVITIERNTYATVILYACPKFFRSFVLIYPFDDNHPFGGSSLHHTREFLHGIMHINHLHRGRINKVTYPKKQLPVLPLALCTAASVYVLIGIIGQPLTDDLGNEPVSPRRLYAEATGLANSAYVFLYRH